MTIFDYRASRRSAPRISYVDLNGEFRETEAESGPLRYLQACCPCFIHPLSDENQAAFIKFLKSFTFPLVVVQLVMMMVELGLGGFAPYSQNPMLGPGGEALYTLGALNGRAVQSGQIWRLVTPMILHAGLIHLLMNMIAELRFGIYLERSWGTIKFVLVFVISGIGASLLSLLWNPNGLSVGASGAILGLMGAHLGHILLTWAQSDPNQRKQLLIQTLVWVVLVFIFSFGSSNIDAAAHTGGFVVGFLLSFGMFHSLFLHPKIKGLYLLLISAVLLTAYFLGGFLYFFLTPIVVT